MNMQGINFQMLFQMLDQQPRPKMSQITKIVINQHFLIQQEEFHSYNNDIKNLYNQVFCSPSTAESQIKKPINLQSKLTFQIKQTPMPICNRILTQNQAVFRCYDCMTHEASVICKKCFQQGNHKGHRYNQIASGGGNCDCGNPDAIKQSGFCCNHPGKAEPVKIIDEQQQANFIEVCLTILQWIFRLYQKDKSKSSDNLGQLFSSFLLKINQRSLYYNTLTFNLLYSNRKYADKLGKKQQIIIDKIFQYGIKCVNFAKKMTDVYLNMFSLQVFKYSLTVSFTKSYNKLKDFQMSKFKSLYIQLFANNDIVYKLLQNQKIVLCPYQKGQYNFPDYLENLTFLSTIKPEVACKFFEILMEKQYIHCPILDQIEKDVQKGNSQIVQLLNIINQNLNNQNYYYALLQSILILVQKKQDTLISMLTNYCKIFMDKKYSYKKNKLVNPFVKIIGLIIFTIYQGNLQRINFQQLQKFTGYTFSIKEIALRSLKLIMQCLRQLSTTFFEPSYFDNYTPLYVRSGNTIVIYDMLMVLVCINILKQTDSTKEMNQILKQIFYIEKQFTINGETNIQKKQLTQKISKIIQQSQEEDWADLEQRDQIQELLINEIQNASSPIQSQQNDKQTQEKTIKHLKQNVQMVRLLLQICISNRSEVLISNCLKLPNQFCKERTQEYFYNLINNFKQIPSENLKNLIRHFIYAKNSGEQLIKKFLTFDKIKKKYLHNTNSSETINFGQQKDRKIPLHLYQTIKKLGGIINLESINKEQQQYQNFIIPKENLQRLKFIFNNEIIDSLGNHFIDKVLTKNQKKQNQKEFRKVFVDFLQVLKTIQKLMKKQTPDSIRSFFQKVEKISQENNYQFLNEFVQRKSQIDSKNNQKQKLMKKFNDKKNKKLEQIKNKQRSFDFKATQNNEQDMDMEEEQVPTCIICRQNDTYKGLCLLASFNYSNILQVLNGVKGRSLVFNSCFHPIHTKCFLNSLKQVDKFIPCPLCKNQSNIILPLEKQILNKTIVQEVYERFTVLNGSFTQIKGTKTKIQQFQQLGVLGILKSLSGMIGKNLLRNQPILNHKDQRLSNILYNFIQTIFNKFLNSNQVKIQGKGVQDYLQFIKPKLNQKLLQRTNFYAFEYLVIKIFFYCLTQKSNQCIDIISQPLISLINKEDLRKLWQMCNQIVALPNQNFKIEESKNDIHEMYHEINFYQPPQSVKQLIQIRDSQQFSCKNGHQMCICVICKTKICYECKDFSKHFKKVHCGQGIAFNLLTGGLQYNIQRKVVHIPSFYTNDIGVEWKPSKTAQGFNFEKQNYQQIKNQVINQTIMKYLSQKFPDAFKKMVFQDAIQQQ